MKKTTRNGFMLRFSKYIAAVLICALLLCGCELLAPAPTEPPTELEMIEAAWDDMVVERTAPVEYIALHAGGFSSFWPHFEKQENIQMLLDICAELDVDTLQSGDPAWKDGHWQGTMYEVKLVTENAEMKLYVETGNVAVILEKGEAKYYAYTQSSTLTREDFGDLWHNIDPNA